MIVYMQMIETEADRHKFEMIYEKYKRLMFRVSLQLLDNEQDAEDAVHQAFLAIIENLKNISDIECLKTRSYIVIITENKAIDLIRARKKLSMQEWDESRHGLEVPLPGDGGLADAMAKLPQRYRAVLLLRYNGGYSIRELAGAFGVSYASMQKLIWRAKQFLQKQLLQEGDECNEEQAPSDHLYR